MYRISLTWISSKTANTATGSTAAISDENRKISSTGMFLPNKLIRVHAYKEAPEIQFDIDTKQIECHRYKKPWIDVDNTIDMHNPLIYDMPTDIFNHLLFCFFFGRFVGAAHRSLTNSEYVEYCTNHSHQ